MHGVSVVHADELTESMPVTPGMDRRLAYQDDKVWVGRVQTQAGVLTGWHTHDGFDTYIHVLRGEVVIEFGPGGHESVSAGPGDFVHVGKWVVHREGTEAGSAGVDIVLVRVGRGRTVVNVDGPEPA